MMTVLWMEKRSWRCRAWTIHQWRKG